MSHIATPAIASDPASAHRRAPQGDVLFTRAFLMILAVQMSFGFTFSIFFLLPKYLTVELGAGPDAVGAVTSSAMIAAVLAVPFLGRAIDRYPRRWLIAGGSAACGLLAAVFPLVHEVGFAMYALRALQGVGFALVFNAGATLVADSAPPARMGQALGFFGLSSLVTNAAAPALGEYVAARAGWSPVFLIATAFSALCTAIALRLPPEGAPASVKSQSAPSQLSGRTRAILYASAIVGTAFGTMFTFSLPFALALGAREVSAFFIGYTISAASVRIVLGGFADRFGRHRVALAALVVYASSLFATIWLRPEWLAPLGALLGIAHGLVYPALNAMVVEGVRIERRGSVMALFNGCFNAGVAISTLVLGGVARRSGYALVFALAGAITLSAVPVLGRATLRKTPPV